MFLFKQCWYDNKRGFHMKKSKEKKSKTEKVKRRIKECKIYSEFKNFLSRGNAFDMAVGVVIGGAFSAIVNSIVSVLMSICTWGVPGGIKGLVTILPAASASQKGIEGIGQSFGKTEIADATIKYAASQGVTIDRSSGAFATWQNGLLSNYTLKGSTYYFNGSALIDWGSIINAFISFLIIGITLFVIVKTVNYLRKVRIEMEEKAREEYYTKHPDERPKPKEPEPPKPTELDVLTQIRDELTQLRESQHK